MKQSWQNLALKIDALSVRERTIIFAAAALVMLTLINLMVLDPLFVKQKQLSLQLQQDQTKNLEIQTEIQKKISAQAVDPDAANRTRLQQLKQQSLQMGAALRDVQKGLVAPDRMATLLEDILKRNSRLRLMSLKTLPVSSLNAVAVPDNQSSAKPLAELAANAAPPTNGNVYRHGVELTMHGSYLDMMQYMATLEAMPWQLFWGRASLSVDEYPNATLTLTLFTLSLDEKWLHL